ncbi:receptor-activated Ca2+-permeable cation channel [Patellaria atrata CBS 101060]|uniref:Receptor-activated Ca2+-permeable cation channel n=1 Tax=Patellaria atrata CBS 101060 TaxID=1346257 RepID=A0A9P4S9K8_9PEZI|nr:receptor-activated Ca2+-permeable cation channel [Patellaria atrata CBS 101060]
MSRPETRRTLSDALRLAQSREEQETLLGDEEVADENGCITDSLSQVIFAPDPHAKLPVYTNIHRIRRLIIASIDDPYTLKQLKEPRLNVMIVRPLVDKLHNPNDVSIVYCLLVNRVQFLREQSRHAHHQTVSGSRAALCELVATKILRRFDEENEGRTALLLLANVLVAPFDPLQNAPDEVIEQSRHAIDWALQKRGGYEGKLIALEIAIISESKHFTSSIACQKVVEAVYHGRIVYTPTSFIDIIPDHYKYKPISLYDPRKAPLLNQYRLVVPRTRNIIEICQFIMLIALYVVTMTRRDHTRWSGYEVVFVVYALGWLLDEFASILAHGIAVHTQNLWSFLDMTFVVIFMAYIVPRIHGYMIGDLEMCRQAVDILATAAPILLARIAFNIMPDNMLFIALRAMMGKFLLLTAISVWLSTGFMLALRWLSLGGSNPPGSPEHAEPIMIAKWMLWIWFGLDGTGISKAPGFHMYLGPALMVVFAFLGNTLFLTVLVAILSETFNKLAEDASSEIQFRRAVMTFEGVKSDAIFAYRPPFNILALGVLVPLRFVLSPRWFHKINVGIVKILNAPILVVVSFYERQYLWKTPKKVHPDGPSKRSWMSFWSFSGFSVHGDIQACFEVDPPQEVIDEIEMIDELNDDIFKNGLQVPQRDVSPGTPDLRSRRMSSIV